MAADVPGPELVTLGETMALFTAPGTGPLRHARTLAVSAAGSESNVAIGAARLGRRSAWISRVGADELGRMVLGEIRAEGVDVSAVIEDPDAQTGLMFKEHRTADLTRVTYYRRDSAASRLAPEDLNRELFAGARVVHVSGVTAALSESARATAFHAVELAREGDALVSVDVNYRSRLWGPDQAGPVLRELAAQADVLFAGDDEAGLVVEEGDTPEEMLERLAELGARHTLLKRGAHGAMALVDGERHVAEPVRVHAVDSVGAGDGFVAGYLSGVIEGLAPPDALRRAALTGAFAVTVDGDWEGLPTLAEVEAFTGQAGTVAR